MALPFVVLQHTGHGEAHFDLMLAVDESGPLLTWRLSEWPMTASTTITPLPPHRRAYLTFEGDVSRGRGRVRRVAAGDYECRQRDETDGVLLAKITGRTLRLPLA